MIPVHKLYLSSHSRYNSSVTNTRRRLLWTFFAIVAVILGTLIAIRFANGQRPTLSGVANNGLLVVNSEPKGARVFINDRFITATDDTQYLNPGEYNVRIEREGYFTWQKTLQVEEAVVTQANALLFPIAPSLSPLTLSGAQNPVPSPDGQKLLYYTASSSAAEKNGYYIMELADNPLAFQRGPRQITRVSSQFPLENTQMLWSPDSSQILLASPQKSVLLDPTRLNEVDSMPDITFQIPTLLSQWEEEMYLRDRERLAKFSDEMQLIATSSAVNVYFSPDEEKLMYTATEVFTLPEGIEPAKPGSSTQQQARTTEVGGIYVYDREEDRQFYLGQDEQYLAWLQLHGGNADASLLPDLSATPSATPRPSSLRLADISEEETASPSALPTVTTQKRLLSDDLFRPRALTIEASPTSFTRLQADSLEQTLENFRTYHSPLFSHGYQWFPNSAHVIRHSSSSISISEYDNTNNVTVYSGPFDGSFVYPWPNGSRLIIRTNFNQGPTVPVNLYTVDLK